MNTVRKIRKLIFHPVLFFRDRKRKILLREKKHIAIRKSKSGSKTKTQKNLKEPKIVKTVIRTFVNQLPVSNVDLKNYEVALYFFGGIGNVYQIEQWISTLKVLNESVSLIIIVRIEAVFTWLTTHTDFTIIFCRTIDDLTYMYETNNIKCVLYVNHGFKNFQSLITGNALHVHINHGESDKISTVTNQSKAYDYVFIVGEAAYDKYNFNLIKKDMNKFIFIGRPQLDHIKSIVPFDIGYTLNSIGEKIQNKKKVILYAPTWEGTHESMNFSSIPELGMSIVQQIMGNPEYFLVYKPHPNTGSRDSTCKTMNNAILKLVSESSNGETVLCGDINSLYEHVDLAIFDNSAVAIDYLQVDKPMLMTDMFYRLRGVQTKPTIISAARMISIDDIYNMSIIVNEELILDSKNEDRNKIKKYFLGDFDYAKNESTDKFVSQVIKIIEERDKLCKELDRLKANL